MCGDHASSVSIELRLDIEELHCLAIHLWIWLEAAHEIALSIMFQDEQRTPKIAKMASSNSF